MLQLLQKTLNHYLALDPESKTRLINLQGKRIAIELLPVKIYFQLYFNATDVELTASDEIKPDTLIKSTPLSLLHMAFAQHDRQRFFAEDVTIEGNIEVGQQVIELFDAMEIDWEEYVSQWVGDVSAHQLGRVMRGLRDFGTRAKETVGQNITEYLHEEANLFPPKEALQDFFQEVDHLQMDVDRLAARIQKISQEISS